MRTFKSGQLEIDPSRSEIRREGRPLPAEKKVLELVFLLVEAADLVVDQDEVQRRLWPSVRVSRDALYRVVKEARALVGDDGRRQALIRTVPGRGLRWLAPVEVFEDTPVSLSDGPSIQRIAELEEAGKILEARDQAFQLARLAAGREHAATRAEALVRAGALVLHGQVDREWMSLARDALTHLPEERWALRAELLSRQAHHLMWSKDPERSREAIRLGRAAAERAESASAHAWLEMCEHTHCSGPEQLAARRQHAERAVEHARRAGIPQLQAWAHEQLANDAMEAADLEAVERAADAIALLEEEHSLVWPDRVQTMLRLYRGDLPGAERALERGFARWGEDMGSLVFQYLGAPLLWLRFEQQRLAEMLPMLRRFVAAGGELAVWRAALARGEFEVGEIEAARSEYEGVVAAGLDAAARHFLAPPALAHLAVLCVAFADRPRAEWLFDQLRPYTGRLIVVPRAHFVIAPADSLLGELAAVVGRREEALALLEAGLDLAERTRGGPAAERGRAALARLQRAG